MNSETATTGRKFGAAAAIVALVLGAAATVVAAQSGPATACTGDSVVQFGSQFFGLQDNGNRLLSTSPTSIEFSINTLPAGTYALNGVSYDGYEQRGTTNAQVQEQWFAEFLGSDGAVLATSGITDDLEDGVVEATWTGSLGNVTLAAPASAVRVVHAAPGSSSVNSVRPVCLGAASTGSAPADDDGTNGSDGTDGTDGTNGSDAPAGTDDTDAPPSTITVDFESNSSSASIIAVTCSVLSESASGVNVNLNLTGVPAGDACSVEYPTNLDCSVGIEPGSVAAASTPGVLNIAVPAAGDTNIFVGIACNDAQVDGEAITPVIIDAVSPTTTAAPEAATATTVAPDAAANATTSTVAPAAAASTPTTTAAPAAVTTTTIATNVAGAVATAPAATAQTGTPTFTG